MRFGHFLSFKSIDKGFIEKLGSTGFPVSISNFSYNLVGFNTGTISIGVFQLISASFLFFIGYVSIF